MVGKSITPKQLAQTWAAASSRFEVNLLNFEILAGKAAKKVFVTSFDLKRFNSSGEAAWVPRKDRRKHPLLKETGTLRDSITWGLYKSNTTGKRGVNIYTDPSVFKFSKRQYNRVICYAAIHNMGGRASGATGKSAFIAKRQFMGYSTVLDDKIRSHYCPVKMDK